MTTRHRRCNQSDQGATAERRCRSFFYSLRINKITSVGEINKITSLGEKRVRERGRPQTHRGTLQPSLGLPSAPRARFPLVIGVALIRLRRGLADSLKISRAVAGSKVENCPSIARVTQRASSCQARLAGSPGRVPNWDSKDWLRYDKPGESQRGQGRGQAALEDVEVL